MLFNSIAFLIFAPIVFILHWILPHKYRWILLLAASYYFYMSWNPELVFLILTTTAVSYFCSLLMAKADDKRKKKMFMLIGVGVSLGFLFFFKYFDFVSVSITNLLKMFSLPVGEMTLKLILPVGISFYTFQTLSYVIDVYHGKIEPEKHFGYYALYVSFFPQLVAGPIERSENLLPQIKAKRNFTYEKGTYGMKLMVWGFFKKIVIADQLAIYVNMMFNDVTSFTGLSLIAATVFFAFQIYCDFSGYSDIAIGTANMFGIDLMTNFKSPYFSSSIKEFWSRWHISLSTWFRDYVYIPLGGNRVGKVRNKFNVLITFLLSGLWHGASWNFVLWGGLNGVYNIVESSNKNIRHKYRNDKKSKWSSILKVFFIFVITCFAWVLFRANSLSDAIYIYKNSFVGIKNIIPYFVDGLHALNITKIVLVNICIPLIILLVFDFYNYKRDIIKEFRKLPLVVRWGVYLFVVIYIIVFFIFSSNTVGTNEFIYFQF